MTDNKPQQGTTRRMFLQLSARAAAGAVIATSGAACSAESDDATTDGGSDADVDGASGDLGPVPDATVDVDGTDADDTDGTDTDADNTDSDGADAAVDSGPTSTADTANISKGPFCNVIGPDRVLLRVETSAPDALVFALITPSGERIEGVPTSATSHVQLEWPPGGLRSDHPDVPGDYTVQDVEFADLVPGQRYQYEISGAPETTPVTGEFLAPPPAGTAFRAAWVADTMAPFSANTSVIAAAAEPDLFLHGGDIQYMSNPIDTWTGYFAAFGDVFRRAPAHHAVGNHEYEEYEEFTELYLRLFGRQGERGSDHYHAFTFGGFRFVFANSEAAGFGTEGDDEQMSWLTEELTSAAAAGERIIVVFHRPYFSFGNYAPDLQKRAVLHALFVEHGVTLVLTGHNHSYERFIVDGVTYIVDGGGGAALYNVDEQIPIIEAERPDEIALRMAAEKSFGALVLDFGSDGSIRGVRTNIDGATTDTFEIAGA